MGKLRRLFLLSILFSVLMTPVSSVPVLFQFQGQISVGNLSATAPVLLNLSVGEWQVEASIGDITVIFNMSVGSVPLVVEINGSLLDDSLKGFSRAIVFSDGKRVPALESEEMPSASSPDWTTGEGASLMIGPSKPVPMGTVILSHSTREYLLLPGGLPVAAEYAGVKKYCLIDISGDKNSWSAYGSCSRQPISNATIPVPVGITSKPANATVYVNGFHLFGEWFTPMRLYLPFTSRLSSYNVSLGTNGYPFVSGVVVSAGRNLTLQVDLLALSRSVSIHPKEGTLRVSTTPPNASIAIFAGNQKVFSGRSPLRLSLPAGTYTISAYLAGYGGVVKNVTVPANGSVSLNMTLSSLPAELNVVTVPPGAKVKVGNRTCTSPCSLNLTAGVYNVSAFLRGYLPNSTLIHLSPGTFRNVSLNLVKMPVLVVATSPAGATVEVGGGECITPCNLSIMPGNHSLKVEKGGYEEAFMIITLRAGEVTHINITLRKTSDKIFTRTPIKTSPTSNKNPDQGYKEINNKWLLPAALVLLLIIALVLRRKR